MSNQTEPGCGWAVLFICLFMILITIDITIEASLHQIADGIDRIAAAQARK